jgi:hypothetical protein
LRVKRPGQEIDVRGSRVCADQLFFSGKKALFGGGLVTRVAERAPGFKLAARFITQPHLPFIVLSEPHRFFLRLFSTHR